MRKETEFYIAGKCWDKIQHYAKYAWKKHKSEIGGMLLAKKDKDNNYCLFEPTILKQEISMGNTELDQDSLAEYYCKMGTKYNDIRFVWWHSHHTMSAFWSGTDLKAIDEMSNGTMSMSLVINLKEEYKFRVNIWKPITTFEDVDLRIDRKTKSIPKSIEKECDELCKPSSLMSSISSYHYGGNSNGIDGRQIALNWDRQSAIMDTQAEIVLNKEHYNQVRNRVETIHQDYEFSGMKKHEYKDYKKSISEVNKVLLENKIDLRVLLLNKKQIDQVIDWLPVESVIHNKFQNCTFDDIMIEYQYDQRVSMS